MKSTTLAGLVLATFNLQAATLYVSLQSTNPVAPYATWETAATVIQDAVDVAKDGDTVLVGDGVYDVGGRLETSNPGFGRRVETRTAITIRSVNGPEATVISGNHGTTGEPQMKCVGMSSPSAVLEGFTITKGSGRGKELWCAGGVQGSCAVKNCIIRNNRDGGVLGCTLEGCLLEDNLDGGVYGGAQWCMLNNCTLTGNSGSGGIDCTFYNCLLTGNKGPSQGFFYNCTVFGNSNGVSGTVLNSIVHSNVGGNYRDNTVLHYCVTSPLPTNGIGNIDADPKFVDLSHNDYRLRPDSPCIDGGTDLLGRQIEVWKPAGGMRLTYAAFLIGTVTDPTDILGSVRGVDGNGDGKGRWDIGAYEYGSFKPPRFAPQVQATQNGFQLSMSGEPNKPIQIERSSDLIHWEPWIVVNGSSNAMPYMDPTPGVQMFYRAVANY